MAALDTNGRQAGARCRERDGTADDPPDPGRAASPYGAPFRPACVSLDLEVGKGNRIQAIGAVRADSNHTQRGS